MTPSPPHHRTVWKTVPAFAAIAALAGCSLTPSSTKLGDHPTWQHIPGWAQQRVKSEWWRAYGDASLNAAVTRAFAGNPDLAVVAARLDRSEAQVQQARAASLPRFNLGIGHRDGREQEVAMGPYDLAPWTSGGQLSWEIDLTGKLRAATRSSRYARDAAFWDVHAARLQLASRIASTHFLINQLNGDLATIRESTAASATLVNVIRAQVDAGIIAGTRFSEQQAQHEQSRQTLQEMERLREIAVIQLRTLIGSSSTASIRTSQQLPYPRAISRLSLDQLLASHPTLLAAEARVRSAFQLEKSAKLNLLPSFRLNASAIGAGSSLTSRYKTWQHQVGPSLDIPIYDPARLAQVKTRKAQSKEAAAQYRSAVLKVLEEIDSAQVNFSNRKKQLASVQREVAALKRAHQHAQSKKAAGIVSDAEPLRAKQNWLAARIRERALRRTLLNDHVSLAKALGGST